MTTTSKRRPGRTAASVAPEDRATSRAATDATAADAHEVVPAAVTGPSSRHTGATLTAASTRADEVGARAATVSNSGTTDTRPTVEARADARRTGGRSRAWETHEASIDVVQDAPTDQTIRPANPTLAGAADASTEWTCSWVAGPDTGAQFVLDDQAIVGRAPGARIRCDDPALEPHHALLVIDGEELRVTQLAGRSALLVDGRHAGDEQVIVDHGLIEIGHSTLAVGRGTVDPLPPAHLRAGAVLRGPRVVPIWDPQPLVPPALPDASRDLPGGLVPALLGISGSAVLALVIRQPMFLLFGALGGTIALGSWVAQRIGLVRGKRRSRRARNNSVAEFCRAEAVLRANYVEHLRTEVSTTVSALATIDRRDHRLWTRRADHADAYSVSLGTGELMWRPPLSQRSPSTDTGSGTGTGDVGADATLRDQPIVLDLRAGMRVALRGGRAATLGIARAVAVQLVANCGPADVRLLVVSHEPWTWRWAAGLPHVVAPDGSAGVIPPGDLPAFLASVDQPGMPHLIVVTDAPELLASRTSPLRRAITTNPGPALLALVSPDAGVPHVCNGVLSIVDAPIGSSAVAARWVADAASSALPASVRIAGLGERAAARAAGILAGCTDPDDPFGATTGLPATVSLLDLLAVEDSTPVTAASVAARWLAAGPDPSPHTPIGIATDGLVDIDLVRDGPHGLFAGTTGSGKSELLRSLVAGMAVGTSPDHLTFVLVDYKGGATFDACAALPHVVGVVTDLDEQLADRALRSLNAELRRREALLRDHGASDLSTLHEVAPHVVLARLVVVIDEFAALVAEQPTFLHALIGVAQRGRSLGVHLLLATQRPNGVISDDIRANTNIRLALRLHDTADAIDVVGDVAPTLLQRRFAGRAVLRLGPEEHITFQAARCTGATPSELDTVVRAVRDAMAIVGVTMPVGPWLPPLPTELDPSDVERIMAAALVHGRPECENTPGDPSDARDGRGHGIGCGDGDGDGDAGGACTDSSRGESAPVYSGYLGLVDDPDSQQVRGLTWRAGDGHLLIVGAPGSGKTSTLVTLGRHVLEHCADAHLYVIDGRGDDALLGLGERRGCAAVVRLHERERMMRLVRRLAAIVDQRAASGGRGDGPQIVLLVDGFTDVRQQLDDLDTVAELEALVRIMAGGAALGVSAVLAVEQAGAMPAAVLARCPQRWMFHVTDRHDASAWGFTAAEVPGPIPGRAAIGNGLHAQLIRPTPPARLHLAEPPRLAGSDPQPIEVLPAVVHTATLRAGWRATGSTWLPLGLAFVTGEPSVLEVPDGEHLLILGPARSGRSTALARVLTAWSEAHPGGWAATLSPRRRRRPGVTGDTGAAGGPDVTTTIYPDLESMLEDLPVDRPAILAIDDADIVDDPGARLAALAGSRRRDLIVVAVGKPDVLRQSYGHWTGIVRRSRLGMAMAACNDLDGELLGALLPRRRPIPARPGLAWLADNGDTRLVQLAADEPP